MSADNGQFSGNPKTEWLNDPTSPDRDMKLLEEFSYTDPNGRTWRAPTGAAVNGASIPGMSMRSAMMFQQSLSHKEIL